MTNSKKPASSLPEAMRWISEITTISLEMALPPIVGSYADNRFHTTPWLALLGALLGMAVGMSHLFRLIRSEDDPPKD